MNVFGVGFILILLALDARSAAIQPSGGGSSFIVNGANETEVITFYGYLEIYHNNVVYFGGSALISRRAVITVAQNVAGFSGWRVGFGGIRISELIWNHVVHAIVHPKYQALTLINNIAVLILERPITPSATIAPYPIPPKGVNFPLTQTTGSVVGFGFGRVNTQPEVLQTATFRVISQDECDRSYPHLSLNNQLGNYFCGVDPNHISNICAGDQGGPIFSPQLNIMYGIASFIRTDDCHLPESSPAAFVRLSEYFDWLEEYLD